MSASAFPYGAAPPAGGVGGTIGGVAGLSEALRRFRTVVALALAISAVVLVMDLLTWTGVIGNGFPPGPRTFAEWWAIGVGVGLQVALGLSIAILVVFGIIYGVLGLIAWRRGVLAMTAFAFEYGPAQIEAARRAREEHSMTLWLFLVYVLVAIAVAIVFAAVNATLSAAQVSSLPGVAASVATGAATGLVLFLIYDFGSRHLTGFLRGLSSAEGRAFLERGRQRLLLGAGVGLVAALSPVFWAFDVAAIASLAIILYGVRDLLAAYDLWQAAHPPAWPVGSGVRAATA